VLTTYTACVETVYNRSTTGRQVVDLLPWPQLRLFANFQN
jgi:hypothetical protein